MKSQKNKEMQRATVQIPAWIVEEGRPFIEEVKIGGLRYQSKKEHAFTDKRAAVEAFVKMMDEVIKGSERVIKQEQVKIKQARSKIKQYKKELKDDAATG